MDDTVRQVVIPRRFCGPPESGNGGYAAGLTARALLEEDSLGLVGGGAVTVSLRMPPPLDTDLWTRHEGAHTDLMSGDDTVAAAQVAEPPAHVVEPVGLAAATAASADFPGHAYHPFPTCFGCGTERPDGLRIFPGTVGRSATGLRVAAAWTPADDLPVESHDPDDPGSAGPGRAAYEVAWTALDCVGGWASDFGDRLMVLGRMTASLDALPAIGEPHVVVAEARGQEGRKSFAASTLYDADGRVVGRAEQVWIGVDPSTFGIAAKERA